MAGRQRATRAGNKAGTAAAPPRRRLPLALATVVIIAGALAATAIVVRPPTVTAQGCASGGAHTGLSAGQCAPNFTLNDLQNRRVSLASLRGHPVLLHFWGVPCTTCRAEFPDFSRIARAYAPKGLRVLAVDAWSDPAPAIQAWQDTHHLPATMLVDVVDEVPQLYGVTGTPTTFFIDAKGRITASAATILSYADFQRNIIHIM